MSKNIFIKLIVRIKSHAIVINLNVKKNIVIVSDLILDVMKHVNAKVAKIKRIYG